MILSKMFQLSPYLSKNCRCTAVMHFNSDYLGPKYSYLLQDNLMTADLDYGPNPNPKQTTFNSKFILCLLFM